MSQDKDGGAFWLATDKETGQKKLTRNGETYMTGNITIGGVKYPCCLFFNRKKENPKAPDINITFNEQKQAHPVPRTQEEEVNVADIPF